MAENGDGCTCPAGLPAGSEHLHGCPLYPQGGYINGCAIEIKRADKICASPLMKLVAEAWVELERSGFGLRGAPYTHEGSAFYADFAGEPIAFIHWSVQGWKQEMWIDLGYVVPEYRGRGLYTALYAAVIDEAKKRGLVSIAGGVHVDNHAMRAVAEKQGRTPSFVTYRADIG